MSPKSVFRLVLALLVMVVASGRANDCRHGVALQVGISQPAGNMGDTWGAGYAVGLESILPAEMAGNQISLRASFQRWTPDAAGMLNRGGLTYKVENHEGWRAGGEVFAQFSRKLPILSGDCRGLWGKLGLGIGYYASSVINVDGVHTAGSARVLRNIYRPAKALVAPGVSLDLSWRLTDRFEPFVRIQSTFGGEDNVSVVMLGMGLLPIGGAGGK